MTKLDKKHRRRQNKAGMAPGTLTVPECATPPVISVIAYKEDDFVEQKITKVEEIKPLLEQWPALWINVDGLGDAGVIEQLGKLFDLHMLSLEDVLTLHQRPKTEYYEGYLFIVMQMAHAHGEGLETEQMSMFVGKNFVLTLQESPGDCFDPVRARLHEGKGRRARFLHSDYLAYALVDAVIDEYFPLLEHYGDRLDDLEEQVVARPRRQVIGDTHQLKRELQQMRHGLWPMREMVNAFSASPALVNEETRPYLRDCYDHIIQVLDMLETYRERASGLVDIYLSSISNHMNEIMQVLTIIATIFMPLSFIASVYGMNFDPSVSPYNMPELKWRFGYPYALGLMVLSLLIMLAFFWRRGWIGGNSEDKARRKQDALDKQG